MSAAGHGHAAAPSAWVRRFAGLVAPHGRVLDLAAGRGRHSALLEALGHRVVAIDRDAAALDAGPASEKRCVDLEAGPWPCSGETFAAVVVTHYLHRPLFAAIEAALAPGGVLIYETFAVGNEMLGKPRHPDFLLRRGELLQAFPSLRVVAFEDGFITTPAPAFVQRICAVRDCAASKDARWLLGDA